MSNSRRNDAGNNPSPSVGLLANAKADKQGEEDANSTRGHVHQGSLGWLVTQVLDQSGRVCRNDTTGDGELQRGKSHVSIKRQ